MTVCDMVRIFLLTASLIITAQPKTCSAAPRQNVAVVEEMPPIETRDPESRTKGHQRHRRDMMSLPTVGTGNKKLVLHAAPTTKVSTFVLEGSGYLEADITTDPTTTILLFEGSGYPEVDTTAAPTTTTSSPNTTTELQGSGTELKPPTDHNSTIATATTTISTTLPITNTTAPTTTSTATPTTNITAAPTTTIPTAPTTTMLSHTKTTASPTTTTIAPTTITTTARSMTTTEAPTTTSSAPTINTTIPLTTTTAAALTTINTSSTTTSTASSTITIAPANTTSSPTETTAGSTPTSRTTSLTAKTASPTITTTTAHTISTVTDISETTARSPAVTTTRAPMVTLAPITTTPTAPTTTTSTPSTTTAPVSTTTTSTQGKARTCNTTTTLAVTTTGPESTPRFMSVVLDLMLAFSSKTPVPEHTDLNSIFSGLRMHISSLRSYTATIINATYLKLDTYTFGVMLQFQVGDLTIPEGSQLTTEIKAGIQETVDQLIYSILSQKDGKQFDLPAVNFNMMGNQIMAELVYQFKEGDIAQPSTILNELLNFRENLASPTTTALHTPVLLPIATPASSRREPGLWGIAIGVPVGVILILILCLITLCYIRRRKRRSYHVQNAIRNRLF